MPEPLTKEEVEKGQDPSVTKQWDNDVSAEKKLEDFYAIVDKQKIGMLGTYRDGVGVCVPTLLFTLVPKYAWFYDGPGYLIANDYKSLSAQGIIYNSYT
ncbi:hypothetical protein KC334_g2978 [Hortaea werneckii]|nr:hypothetical protein KC334_g2978 [Hortaea werneckii]